METRAEKRQADGFGCRYRALSRRSQTDAWSVQHDLPAGKSTLLHCTLYCLGDVENVVLVHLLLRLSNNHPRYPFPTFAPLFAVPPFLSIEMDCGVGWLSRQCILASTTATQTKLLVSRQTGVPARMKMDAQIGSTNSTGEAQHL